MLILIMSFLQSHSRLLKQLTVLLYHPFSKFPPRTSSIYIYSLLPQYLPLGLNDELSTELVVSESRLNTVPRERLKRKHEIQHLLSFRHCISCRKGLRKVLYISFRTMKGPNFVRIEYKTRPSVQNRCIKYTCQRNG